MRELIHMKSGIFNNYQENLKYCLHTHLIKKKKLTERKSCDINSSSSYVGTDQVFDLALLEFLQVAFPFGGFTIAV